ncbi:hypothetical protein P4601_20195 [Peribacillus frigoritolerans]|uniref:hypothetical protein n=1 Tax=Peribacillus frigoritolerans TaxID=450367 RepID=UPI000A5EC2F2|nr:hypothetical protein [Peribacillus frigoritolerans]MED3711512.1 hypothetical protein [Peribacillus frigoritolerans]MED3892219.1 hypothetical protein [Peribacillus frigoritolerans]ULM99101.1 hypothetical protein L8956_10675 [Peribacillus frigoritolerans]
MSMIDNLLYKENDETSVESVEGEAAINSPNGRSDAPPIAQSKDPEFDLFGTGLNGYPF